MQWYYYLLIAIGTIILVILLISYICFRKVFYSKNKVYPQTDEVYLPKSELYEEYRDIIIQDIKDARKLPYKTFKVKSFDGLLLSGKYYENNPRDPIEIMFHGYRGTGERDLSTGIKRAFLCNHNALIIDQRATCDSEGHIISFGINEYRDCIVWANYIANKFKDCEVILTGISMGAATVLMASSTPLPSNVIAILADCGYNKASDIIKKVIKDMHLPANILYPFVKMGARVFGHFNLEETSPYQEVQKSRLPIIFFHGTNDSLVPCEMSEKLYEACTSEKKIVTIKDGRHGTSYLKNPELYLKEAINFFNKYQKKI